MTTIETYTNLLEAVQRNVIQHDQSGELPDDFDAEYDLFANLKGRDLAVEYTVKEGVIDDETVALMISNEGGIPAPVATYLRDILNPESTRRPHDMVTPIINYLTTAADQALDLYGTDDPEVKKRIEMAFGVVLVLAFWENNTVIMDDVFALFDRIGNDNPLIDLIREGHELGMKPGWAMA